MPVQNSTPAVYEVQTYLPIVQDFFEINLFVVVFFNCEPFDKGLLVQKQRCCWRQTVMKTLGLWKSRSKKCLLTYGCLLFIYFWLKGPGRDAVCVLGLKCCCVARLACWQEARCAGSRLDRGSLVLGHNTPLRGLLGHGREWLKMPEILLALQLCCLEVGGGLCGGLPLRRPVWASEMWPHHKRQGLNWGLSRKPSNTDSKQKYSLGFQMS